MKLIAVSGGVDSMCLLHMMRYEDISVVHINHNTRGAENIAEEELVKNFCLQEKKNFFKYDFVYTKKGNFQKEARTFRYEKFKYLIKQFNFEAVYLAHHFDDQIENILMNPLKIGSKIMKEIENIDGIKVVRPLLNKFKQDLYKYAKINNVKYLEDSSNNVTKYHRNFIRTILKNYTDDQKVKVFTKEKKRSDMILKKIEEFEKFEKIKIGILNNKINIYCYLKSQKIQSNISNSKLNLIECFLKKNKNGEIHIDKNIILLNSYGVVSLSNKKNINQKSNKIKAIACKKYIFNDFEVIFKENGYIRQVKSGDKYKIKNGHKKVSRFFIDEKIPQKFRSNWPILVNEEDEIIYVPKKEEVKIIEE